MLLAVVINEWSVADRKARLQSEQLAVAIDAAQLGRWEWDLATHADLVGRDAADVQSLPTCPSAPRRSNA